MNKLNIILITISSMTIVWSLVKIIFDCTIAIIHAIDRPQSKITFNLTFPAWLLTISVAILLLNCLV